MFPPIPSCPLPECADRRLHAIVCLYSTGRRSLRRLLGRSPRNKSPKQMAFPHQQPGKDHKRKEDKPSRVGVLRQLFKRTVDISKNRNADDDVNPAKNQTLVHDVHASFSMRRYSSPATTRSMLPRN